MNASDIIEHKNYISGEYVFHKGDESNCFFGIIKGIVNIVLEIEVNVKVKVSPDEDIYEIKKETITKIFSLREGAVFGELGLIQNQARSAHAVANGSVDLFIINRDCYVNNFKKPMQLAEKNRRVFFLSIFPEISKLTDKSKDYIFRKMVFKYYNHGDIIHQQGQSANTIYLIYTGECFLYAKFKSDYNEFNIVDNIRLQKVTRGYVAGLDTFKENINDGTKVISRAVYEQTLVCQSQYVTIIEIDKNSIKDLCPALAERLLNQFKSKSKVFKNKIKSFKIQREKFKVYYQYDILSSKIDKDRDFTKENEIVINNAYRDAKIVSVNKRPVTANQFRPKSVAANRSKKIEEEVIPKTNRNSVVVYDNIRSILEKNNIYSPLTKFINKTYKKESVISQEINLNSSSNSFSKSRKSSRKNSYITQPLSLINTTNRVSFKQNRIQRFSSFVPKTINFDEDVNKKPINNLSNDMIKLKFMRKSTILSNDNFIKEHENEPQDNVQLNNSNKNLILELRDLTNNRISYKKVNNKWKEQKNKGSYLSGCFELPLYTKLNK